MVATITMYAFILISLVLTVLPFFLIYLFIKRYKSKLKVKTQAPEGLSYKEEKKFEAIQNIKIYVYVFVLTFAFIALITFANFSPFLEKLAGGLALFAIGGMLLALSSMFIGGFRR